MSRRSADLVREKKGGLAAWQERRSKDMLLANIKGEVRLEDLAGACGLSRSHFARSFKRSTGQTPMQWLRFKRLEHATKLLLSTDLRIDQIAIQCGFSDQSHLTRAFLKAFGDPPASWRRLHRS